MPDVMCLSRCLCIHSKMQLVDMTISSLLLHHGFIPEPICRISSPAPTGLEKTIQGISCVQQELRALFRSKHRCSIEQIVVKIGPNPYKSTASYSIPVNICDGDETDNQNCGSPCQELSIQEQRKVNLLLFRKYPPEEARSHGQRIFVYARVSNNITGEHFNIDECNTDISDEKINKIEFNHRECNKEASTVGDLRWIRLTPFIVQGKC